MEKQSTFAKNQGNPGKKNFSPATQGN